MSDEDEYQRHRDAATRRHAIVAAATVLTALAAVAAVTWVRAQPHRAVNPPTQVPSLSPSIVAATVNPSLLHCAGELRLTGVFNECAAQVAASPPSCMVAAHSLNVEVRLHGGHHDYLLYVTVGSATHPPPAVYDLAPAPAATVGASVLVREYATGALWQSVDGTLNVNGDGSGSLTARLAYLGGEPTPPPVDLTIDGPWTCT